MEVVLWTNGGCCWVDVHEDDVVERSNEASGVAGL
jgi:hypothetical protein